MESGKSVSRLIAIPAVITLAITILRLVGELQHWPKPWFSAAAGGGNALIGISWLPILFGPYFAMKLAGAGERPASIGKAIGFAFLGVPVLAFAGWWFGRIMRSPSPLAALPFLLMLVAAFIPGIGWGALERALLAYGFAARIPVVIVMFLAMHGNDGAGWGTHYDAVQPSLAGLSVNARFFYLGLMPQLTAWIAWTAIAGAIVGTLLVAVTGRGKQPATAGA